MRRVSQTGYRSHVSQARECYTVELVKRYWCYIMSNKSRRLYVGFTDNIVSRTVEHKEKLFPNSFTAQYVFDMLVYYEEHTSVIRAKMQEEDARKGNQGLAPRKEAETNFGPEPGLGRLEPGVAREPRMEPRAGSSI